MVCNKWQRDLMRSVPQIFANPRIFYVLQETRLPLQEVAVCFYDYVFRVAALIAKIEADGRAKGS